MNGGGFRRRVCILPVARSAVDAIGACRMDSDGDLCASPVKALSWFRKIAAMPGCDRLTAE